MTKRMKYNREESALRDALFMCLTERYLVAFGFKGNKLELWHASKGHSVMDFIGF